MAVLENYQWELDGVVFGRGKNVEAEADGFAPGASESVNQDGNRSITDSIAFGRDSKTPTPWSWVLHTDNAKNAVDAVADLAELGRAWVSTANSKTPGKVSQLRYKFADRTRIIFGRAREWTPTMANGILYGYIEAEGEFQPADTLYYDDELQSTAVTSVPAEPSGLVAPIISPVTTLAGGERSGTIGTVGGDVPAPFIATISGPALNPKVSTDDWELQLLTSIPEGMTVTLSTYPWSMRAVRSDGAILSGRLSAKSRLSKARLNPGGETLYYDVTDATGTSTCTVTWRAAYTTI